jgi:anti-sigma-K factor RskA
MAAGDHDRIEELLAGYVLQSLSGEDASRADRLLAGHVPTCSLCREILVEFQAVTGDLALTVPPLEPPDTLLPRLQREIRSAPAPARAHRFSVPAMAAAASFVALVAVAGFAVSLSGRVDEAESQRRLVTQALSDASAGGAAPVGLQAEEGNRPDNAMVEISGPELERLTLVGTGVPAPRSGDVYRIWFGRGGEWDYAGEFVPEGGYVVLALTIDTGQYDQLLITEEPATAEATTPAEDWAWSSSLAS